ncbi:hypothetical protein [Thalassotalea sediminis]|uniref:hypothetical protein n=1 Tax=Thalassotalea sediminis TaxID=1759089 RepID=UPI00257407BB|nr:hypothetical protein [Thalassotalea sediminis]
MSAYDFFGALNSVLIFVSLFGVFSQLQTIWQRKHLKRNKEQATALLSLNQFAVSYLAYLSFFIYGYSISPFNHYIVWPRLIAAVLVLLIIFEIWRERKTKQSFVCVSVATSTLLLALVGLFVGSDIDDQGQYIATVMILVISVLIAQGYLHQIKVILLSGETGAVDIKMSQFIFMMDMSTIAFALSMGITNGWPLLVLAITSALTKIAIMYLFWWVKVSPIAAKRRAQSLLS